MGDNKLGEIVASYDRNVLVPAVGKGALRERLLGGLEKEIRRVYPTYDNPTDDLLDRNIDYEAIFDIETKANKHVTARLRRAFKRKGIRTYGDLLEYARATVGDKAIGGRRRPLSIRGVGFVAEECLYAHLQRIGIMLFGTDYTREEMHVYTRLFGATGKQRNLLDSPVGSGLDLSGRAVNCLASSGIFRVSELLGRTEESLRKIRNLGKITMKEIREKVGRKGFSLKA